MSRTRLEAYLESLSDRRFVQLVDVVGVHAASRIIKKLADHVITCVELLDHKVNVDTYAYTVTYNMVLEKYVDRFTIGWKQMDTSTLVIDERLRIPHLEGEYTAYKTTVENPLTYTGWLLEETGE